jgi:hypothetical protein
MPQKELTHKENCAVCGSQLVYSTESIPVTCSYCGQNLNAQIYCPLGHYVCDSCHELQAIDILKQVINKSVSCNPLEILEEILAHPSVPMHGPEHHVIVPVVLITAVRNSGYAIPENAIEKAISRGQHIPGGWCGSHGNCGAAVGAGIAVSVLTGSTPLKGRERTLSIRMTAKALERIADDQPRCCKRSSRKAIQAAVEFLRENLNINLPVSERVPCRYTERNRECARENCIYYGYRQNKKNRKED